VKRVTNTRMIRGTLFALAFCLLPFSVESQTPQQESELHSRRNDADSAQEGRSLFRANCSPCHGLNAKGGGRGPDLASGRWAHGASDAEVFRTISQGVPGTAMPANAFDDTEIWALVAYLRSLAPPQQTMLAGNPARGQKLFSGSSGCATCHMVKGIGGALGPDLSRVGASRSVAYLIESIREPDKELSDGMLDPNNHYGLPLVYDTVTVTLLNGEKIMGVAKNEDTFSLQLLDTSQRLRLFRKSQLKAVLHERKSLMPAYSESMLSAADLDDLIAYLETLHGL
jgi:putative heme-binding domain-containing protein